MLRTIWCLLFVYVSVSVFLPFLALFHAVLELLMYVHCWCLLSDELGRVRLRHGPKPGSDYINASFIDVCVMNFYQYQTHIYTSLYRVTSSKRHTLLLKVLCLVQWMICGGWYGNTTVPPLSCSVTSLRMIRWITVLTSKVLHVWYYTDQAKLMTLAERLFSF